MKLGILKEFNNKHVNYIEACKELKIDYEVIDISSDNWIEIIKTSKCDGFLVRPSCDKQDWKNMFDERLYYITKFMNKKIYPSYDACYIYESKNRMYYWLEVNNFPHVETHVFYDKNSALEFLKKCDYPLVFKPNLGSSCVGIKFINNYKDGKKIVNKAFPFKGLGNGLIKKHNTRYKFIKRPAYDDRQYNYVMFQKKEDVIAEWRIIKIGDSFFGHQKLIDDKGFHSGAGIGAIWRKPPKKLLNLCSDICEKGNFNSMACDIFETSEGKFYVNELQTTFGSYAESQMIINGKPGRYIKNNKEFIFEEGIFNRHGSYLLRVEDFVKELKQSGEKNK